MSPSDDGTDGPSTEPDVERKLPITEQVERAGGGFRGGWTSEMAVGVSSANHPRAHHSRGVTHPRPLGKELVCLSRGSRFISSCREQD